MVDTDSLMKIYTILVKAQNPYEVFGSPLILDQVNTRYKKLVSITHPDHYQGNKDLLPLAEEATKILNAYYKEATNLCGGTKQKTTSVVTTTKQPRGDIVTTKPKVPPKSFTDKLADFFNDPRVVKTNKFLRHWNDRLVAREEANNGSLFGGEMFRDDEPEPEPRRRSNRRPERKRDVMREDRDRRGDHL